MEAKTLQYVAAACDTEIAPALRATLIHRVCTDSRQLQPGDLFFALAGEKFDGHDYLPVAARAGAAAAVVARDRAASVSGMSLSMALVFVRDTRVALGRLAARYRADFDVPIVAVCGSNGKTTTKELLAAMLRQRMKTLWSPASYNNEIGVPLTLLDLDRSHGAAVLEAGTNHPGELGPLLNMIKPRYGLLTNIGREHMEFFGDLSGVAQEEGALAEAIPAEGRFFVNGDSEWTRSLVARTRTTAQSVRVGFGATNDWRARDVRVSEDGMQFTVDAPQVEFSGEYCLRLLGRHQVPNALLALAVGTELGVTPGEARDGLAGCMAPPRRLQIREANGVRILDDAYNANADSVLAALETLHDVPCAGRRVAVLGEMAELGPHTAGAHREAGRRCGELGIDEVLAVGRHAAETVAAAQEAGVGAAEQAGDIERATSILRGRVRAGDLVLIKASRVAGLERIGEALCSRSC